MDNSVMVMEESHWKNDSAASTSKFGSLVQINSIAIDISSSMEVMESPKHEHFSIRGFVAENRKKDQKACLPFASESNLVDLEDNLPPLFVPRFRWWRCSNCIPDIETKRTTKEMVAATRSDADTSSCRNVGGEDSLSPRSRENTGNQFRLRDNAEGEENDQKRTIKNSNLCCIERQKATTSSKGKTDVRDKEAGNQCDKPEANTLQIIERLDSTTDASDRVCIAEHPSCIVDELDNSSSGSDGTFGALPHRRKQKLRSLADIMVKEKNPTTENPRTRSASFCGMQVASTETEAVLGPQPQLDVPADVAKAATPQPQVDVPADVAKAATSPERKRKTALGEDGGPVGVTYPSAAAKRIKGPMLDARKNCRRVEISDSESDGNASMRSDLRLDARTQRVKPKKSKAFDITKKMRQIHREDGTAPMRELPQMNAACSANLQKHAVPLETSFGKSGNVASTMGETGLDFRSSQFGLQREKIFKLSKSKPPEVGADNGPLMPPSKSILRDCNIRGKVALDLSLNSFMDAERNSNNQVSCRQHRGIPDLNEESPEKTAMTQAQQLTTVSENRSLPLHKNLDVSGSCINETTTEGKRQLRISDLKNNEHNMELGASDDIPMEIVELLAKNQHERALENSGRHFPGINNSTRGYSAPYVDSHPGMIDFPLANRRSGLPAANGNMGVRQSIPINFPQSSNCRLNMSKSEESQFKIFSSSPLSQQRKAQYAASSSTMAGRRSSTGAELLWPSMRENAPFHLSIPQKHSVQPNTGMGVHSFSDRFHKGKNTSDVKGVKERNSAVLKNGRIGHVSTSIGSMDPYSNDTIPAMQLLSLMDQRVGSGSSFEVGSKSFLDKSFSPCNHHPRLNGKENCNFLGGSFFSQNSHSKDLSVRYGVCCSGESSKRASSNLRAQTPLELGNSKAAPLKGSSDLAVQPARSNLALGICTLNRNPADFSIPDVRNEFTLSAKDLKSRKRNASKIKPRMVNVEGRKRERMRKDASEKEGSRK